MEHVNGQTGHLLRDLIGLGSNHKTLRILPERYTQRVARLTIAGVLLMELFGRLAALVNIRGSCTMVIKEYMV